MGEALGIIRDDAGQNAINYVTGDDAAERKAADNYEKFFHRGFFDLFLRLQG
jgi:hypothetical protein